MFSSFLSSLAHSELSSVFYEKVLVMAWGYVVYEFLFLVLVNNEVDYGGWGW